MSNCKDPGVIAVGVDGSPESLAAARFAVEEAVARGLQVQLLHAYQVPRMGRTTIDAEMAERCRERGEHLLQQVKAQLEVPRRLHLETILREITPAVLIGDAAAMADMVVLGRHHRDSGTRLTLGDLASQLMDTAPCPVVTVPAGQPEQGSTTRPVVVALDGDPPAGAVLDFAIEAAVLRQTHLVALRAAALDTWPVDVEAGRATVSDLVRRRSDALPATRVLILVMPGDPDEVIVEASRHAGVLILGSPPDGRLGAWASSVAHAVLSSANCPLVIVPRPLSSASGEPGTKDLWSR